MSQLPPDTGPVLVTLTIGGNDLIKSLRQPVEEGLTALGERLEHTLGKLRDAFRDLTILQGNIYDPTDGSGILGSGADWFYPARTRLGQYNENLAAIAAAHGAHLVDIHQAFLGHAQEYYSFDIEPGVRGAHALRCLWWRALTKDRATASQGAEDTCAGSEPPSGPD